MKLDPCGWTIVCSFSPYISLWIRLRFRFSLLPLLLRLIRSLTGRNQPALPVGKIVAPTAKSDRYVVLGPEAPNERKER